MLNGEWLNSFFIKSGTRQGCALLPLLFTIIMSLLPSATGKKRKQKYTDPKVRNKLSLFADNTIVYIGNFKESTKKTPRNNEFNKVGGCKIHK